MLKRNEEAASKCAFKRAQQTGNIATGYEYLELWAERNNNINYLKTQCEFEKLWCQHIGVDYNEVIKH